MKYDIVIAHRVCPALSKTAVGFADAQYGRSNYQVAKDSSS